VVSLPIGTLTAPLPPRSTIPTAGTYTLDPKESDREMILRAFAFNRGWQRYSRPAKTFLNMELERFEELDDSRKPQVLPSWPRHTNITNKQLAARVLALRSGLFCCPLGARTRLPTRHTSRSSERAVHPNAHAALSTYSAGAP
jgi:hypothetical protein